MAKKAEHGTRTMYGKGCRCEACCKAEHEQYLKRPESQKRKRTYSKHGDIPHRAKSDRQLAYDAERRRRLKSGKHSLDRPIHWQDISESFGMKCAICGIKVDEHDRWINESGRHCFGGKYPTVDHIVSLKNGGTDTFDNVQLACKHCNSSKGSRNKKGRYFAYEFETN